VAGDFDESQAKKWIEKYFAPIKGRQDIPQVNRLFSNGFSGEVRLDVPDNVQIPRLYMAYHIPAFGEKEWYVADFLSDLLTTGKSSRLHHALVYQKQMAHNIQAFSFGTEGTALLMFIATPQKNYTLDQLEKELLIELDKIINGEVSSQEISRIRNQIEAHKLLELQSVSQIADAFNSAATHFDDPGYVNLELDIYGAISKDDIAGFARTYFKDSNRIVLNYLPK
jgi:predicted Zn-dependent peptidase